jgi:hypothetical protein
VGTCYDAASLSEYIDTSGDLRDPMTRQAFSGAELRALARTARCSRIDVLALQRKRLARIEVDGLLGALESELTSELIACLQEAESCGFIPAQSVFSMRCILNDLSTLSSDATLPLLIRVLQNMDGALVHRAAVILAELMNLPTSSSSADAS